MRRRLVRWGAAIVLFTCIAAAAAAEALAAGREEHAAEVERLEARRTFSERSRTLSATAACHTQLQV